jgi:glycosyltransferase involved in cell wall biosynthesis
VDLAAVSGGGEAEIHAFVKTFAASVGPARLGCSRAMRQWLNKEASSGTVDLIHTHSLWMMPNLYAGWAARKGETRLVVSPRGTLAAEALAISNGVKCLFWPLLQKPAIANAVGFHATAENELQDIRRMGFTQPVAVIPNGVELPPACLDPPPGKPKTLLYLGRLHPIKGLNVLVRAWARIAPRHGDWRLIIAGPSERGCREELQELARVMECPRIKFKGPIYGSAKLEAYREAALFVLPSRSENFGMTVAEALAAGTPCITTHGTPWKGITEHHAGWWIPLSEAALADALHAAMSRPEAELKAMGNNGRQWMAREFAWDRIGYMMGETYRWLKLGGKAPDWVDAGASSLCQTYCGKSR